MVGVGLSSSVTEIWSLVRWFLVSLGRSGVLVRSVAFFESLNFGVFRLFRYEEQGHELFFLSSS